MEPTSTTDEFALETAACLWEAVLGLRDYAGPDEAATTLAGQIREAFESLGTAALRLTVVGWTGAVDTAWMHAHQTYELAFDWDFVPEWITTHIDWSDPFHPCILPATRVPQGYDVEVPMLLKAVVRTDGGPDTARHIGEALIEAIERRNTCLHGETHDVPAATEFSIVRIDATMSVIPISDEE